MPATVAELKALLTAGKATEARALVDTLIQESPADPEVRAAFEGLYLAEGVKLAGRARDLRREAIRKLPPKDLDYEDPGEVAAAFDASLACFDQVLAHDPRNVKALVLRAGVLHNKERDRERTLGLLQKALEINPEARDVQMNLRKVMRPCAACGDTGFCRACLGRGTRTSLLGREGRCEACLGQGVCRKCTLL